MCPELNITSAVNPPTVVPSGPVGFRASVTLVCSISGGASFNRTRTCLYNSQTQKYELMGDPVECGRKYNLTQPSGTALVICLPLGLLKELPMAFEKWCYFPPVTRAPSALQFTQCLRQLSNTPVSTLRSRHNGHNFTHDIFRFIFLNENIWISIKDVYVLRGPIDNKPALVQEMAWHRTSDKPLSEPMMTQFSDAYMRHSASMS